MPQVIEPLRGNPEPPPNRIRWTRAQCDAIREAGVLQGRYELIDGEIISKMGQKPPHASVIGFLVRWLARVFGLDYVRVQCTIDVGGADPDHNEPEPDVAVTRLPVDDYVDHHPGSADLLLVAEVSDTTLRFDRRTKAGLYASAGIQEYWILDLQGRQLLVHRQPAEGGYLEITAYGPAELVATLARPAASVRVEELLPPAK
jgi:Uma2 family endonuclease